MKGTIANKIRSFNATLAAADQADFKLVWSGRTPLAFDTGLAAIRPLLTSLIAKGARQHGSAGGEAGALKDLRADYQKYLHRLARATFQTLTRLGRTTEVASVDLTPSDLLRARAKALVGIGEMVMDIAEPLSVTPADGGEAPGQPEGVTPEALAKVEALWQRYSAAVGAPAGARAGLKALTGQLQQEVRNIEAKFAALDDLVIQFDETPAGVQFVAAWFSARQVVDLGRRAAKGDSTEKPPQA